MADPPKTRVVTVRMPEDLHEDIRIVSLDTERSMNQFCLDSIRDSLESHLTQHRATLLGAVKLIEKKAVEK